MAILCRYRPIVSKGFRMGKNTSITATFGGSLLRFSILLLLCACHRSEVPPAEYPPLDPVPSTVIEANPSTPVAPTESIQSGAPAAADAGITSTSEPPQEGATPAATTTPAEEPPAASGHNP